MKLKLLFLCVVGLFAHIVIFPQRPETTYQPMGIIHGQAEGIVTNVSGTPIPGLDVIFESHFEIRVATTNAQGKYSIQLPPTAYKVTTRPWTGRLVGERRVPDSCSAYFRQYQRSSIHVHVDQTLRLNFVITEAECVLPYDDAPGSGMFSVPSHGVYIRLRFETLYFPQDEFGDQSDLMVAFGNRALKAGKITYSPPQDGGTFLGEPSKLLFATPFPGVVITYDTRTFYAERAVYDVNERVLAVPSGKIFLDNDGKTIPLKSLNIRITDSTVNIAYEPK